MYISSHNWIYKKTYFINYNSLQSVKVSLSAFSILCCVLSLHFALLNHAPMYWLHESLHIIFPNKKRRYFFHLNLWSWNSCTHLQLYSILSSIHYFLYIKHNLPCTLFTIYMFKIAPFMLIWIWTQHGQCQSE